MNPKQKSALTKIFAVAGTAMLWAPILFMFLTAITGSIARKALLMDYLMLAELFPAVALGMALLLAASLMTRLYRKWFIWGCAATVATLVGGQLIAMLSGLASGAREPEGIFFAIVIGFIVLFDLIVIAFAILAVFLIKKLFQKQPGQPPATK